MAKQWKGSERISESRDFREMKDTANGQHHNTKQQKCPMLERSTN